MLRVLQLSPNHCTACWKDIVFSIWRPTPMTAETCRVFVNHTVNYAKKRPLNKVAVVAILDERSDVPTKEVRAELDATAPIVANHELCSVMIYRGGGFKGAIVRGVVTSLNLLAKSQVQQKVFSSIDEAAPWLVNQLRTKSTEQYSVEELVQVTNDLLKNIEENKVSVTG